MRRMQPARARAFAGWSVSSAGPQLPQRVASHFNTRGLLDGYMAFFTDLALLSGCFFALLLHTRCRSTSATPNL